jgi:hypothetical protein
LFHPAFHQGKTRLQSRFSSRSLRYDTMKAFALRLTAITALLLATGCTAVIKAPAEPENPRPIFVLEHGRHTSLVLTNRDGLPVRYAFGELAWYAHSQTGFFRGMSALLTPTAGTLGRRELEGPPLAENIRRATGVGIETVHCIAVPAERIDRLGDVLDTLFNEHIESLHYNLGMNLEFVEIPEKYWFGNNSNVAVARWLEMLDATVGGSTVFANWRVVHPEGEVPGVCVMEGVGS